MVMRRPLPVYPDKQTFSASECASREYDAGLPGQIVCERWRGAKACRRDEQSRECETSERHSERPNPFSATVLMLCKRISIA
jgi:hypothetical protein